MTGDQVRQKYLDFFKKKGHSLVQSDLLVPANDPTLLFTGAGMNQFKEQFMGKNISYPRAISCQKCLRTGDLDNVGKTPRHHTFFEMLGNFSFGDYFKKEAISWAWEFMTEEMGFPKEKLWVSVYHEDEVSYDIWSKDVKILEDKIVRLGAKDNFWPADAPAKGPNGPCGPCSEIFYDWGPERGCGEDTCSPACDCGRFLEVWNLVFTEFERKPDGELIPLPNKNIDTGMGLERITSVMQGRSTNFGIDLFSPIIEAINGQLSAVKILTEADINLIADHIRAAVFTVCDGVSPSNEKRGYVVRKLIRRAYLKGEFLKKPFLYAIVPVVVDVYKGTYPDLEEKREHIAAIIYEEEKRFIDTLGSAMPILSNMLNDNSEFLNGKNIFKLVDTYGMPVEVISMMSDDRGFSMDLEGFERLMEERKELSRKGSDIEGDFIFQPDLFADARASEYSKDLPLEADIVFIVKDGEKADAIFEDEKGEIVISPQSGIFYAESGGQVGDTGCIKKDDSIMNIVNTYKTGEKKIFKVYAERGTFSVGDKIIVELDSMGKKRTSCNHTATHLLQAALRQVLGDHVKQSGSYVDMRRLRFDFTHMKKIDSRDIDRIERSVNGWIRDGIGVGKNIKSLSEAKTEGALSFFGEKYGDTVRVIDVGDVSKELCGGDHVDNTSEIKIFKIISESSIASGIRRIEAVTGDNAEKWIKTRLEGFVSEYDSYVADRTIGKDIIKEVSGVSDAVNKAYGIIKGEITIDADIISDLDLEIIPAFIKIKEYVSRKIKKRQKAMEAENFAVVKEKVDELLQDKAKTGGMTLIFDVFDGMDMQVMRKAVSYAEKKIDTGIIIFGNISGGKVQVQCAVTEDIAGDRFSAKDIVNKMSGFIKGGGGGNDSFAQAGGKNPGGVKEAMSEIENMIKDNVA